MFRGIAIPAWGELETEVLKRMHTQHIHESELRAIMIEWPEGVNGRREPMPSCIKLTLQGLRAQGYVVPSWAIHEVQGTAVHGLPLVCVYPQHPVHESDVEYVDTRSVSTSVSTVRVYA